MTLGTRAWTLAVCCLATLFIRSSAQTSTAPDISRTANTAVAIKTSTKERKAPAPDQQQRTLAISLIETVVDEAQRYQDLALRARIQVRAADALWQADESLARKRFNDAWKAAEKADNESERTSEEARRKALNSQGAGLLMVAPPANLRGEVLKFAARRDPALGESLISQMDKTSKEDDQDSDQKNAPTVLDPTEPKFAIAKRLEVALQLLAAGNVRQAKDFAAPALGYTTSQGIIFLCALRLKDAEAADRVYAKLLTLAANDPTTEATTVSLLSSYAFTPNVLVTATRRGRVSNQFSDAAQSYDLAPGLRTSFFSVAATILLRPMAPPDQDSTLAGRAGTYFTIVRLLPLFEQYAVNYVPALKAQLAALSLDAPETFRNGQDSMLRVGLAPDGSKRETLQEILDQLAGLSSSAERDALYIKAIQAGTANADLRIREFAGQIEDVNLRDSARIFADLVIVRSAIDKKDVDGGIRIVRNGFLTSLHRVWAMTEIGGLLKKSDPASANQLFDDAAAEANRIGVGEPDRVYALACVSTSFLAVDRFRSWSLAQDAVKAANAVPGFTGDDAKLSARLRTRNTISMMNSEQPSFNVVNLFDLLARDNLHLAISTVTGLKSESARATTSLAVARSVLEGRRPVRK